MLKFLRAGLQVLSQSRRPHQSSAIYEPHLLLDCVVTVSHRTACWHSYHACGKHINAFSTPANVDVSKDTENFESADDGVDNGGGAATISSGGGEAGTR